MDDHRQRFPSPFILLLRVNLLQAVRRVTQAGSKSGLLTVMIGLFLLFYPLIASGMFYAGLRYVSKFPGLGDMLIERLVFLLFAFLFMLLLFSNIVVGYTNMFRNQETRFLQTLPFSANNIFRWKLIETTFVASWAFMLLVAPLLLAYGIFQSQQPGHQVGWQYYILTPPLVLMFILLPSIFGCWIAVFMARHLDRSLFQTTAVLLLLALIYMVIVYLQPDAASVQTLETRVVDLTDRLLSKTQFAQFPFLPSYWLSSAITNWVEGAKSLAAFFVLVLVSNVLFFGFLGFTETGKYFYKSLFATLSRGSLAGDWSNAARLIPRLCAQLILLAWFLPIIDFHPLKEHWHQRLAPLTQSYAAQKKSDVIQGQDLGRWVTNQVTQLEPQLARGAFYALKPGLRRLTQRSASGEMQQLGPDLEHLINANIRQNLSGLDIVRRRTVLRGKAEEFSDEPKATLMPEAASTLTTLLHKIGPLKTKGTSVQFAGRANISPVNTNDMYRIHMRKKITKVDEKQEPIDETIWVTDHGNYLEGHLVAEGNQLRLNLHNPFPEDETPAGVVGIDANSFWHSQTSPPNGEPDKGNFSWILGHVVPAVYSQQPEPVQHAGLPLVSLLAIPVLALLAWVINSRAVHLLGALATIGLFIVLVAQSNHWLAVLDGGKGSSAFGVAGSQFIGIGVWIMLFFALVQGVFTIWQKPLCSQYEAWYLSRAQREKDKDFHYRPSTAEFIMRRIPFISSDVLALLLKDIRLFWRDTAQWGQSLILFGILGVYILNLRFFTEQFTSLFNDGRLSGDYFFKLVSFMNLAACALNLATLTTRFVYPQFSLEGKRLWIVGMSPLGLERVVKVKFLLATSISLLISFPLIWLSSNMLQLPTVQKLFFCGAISVMAIALNGLAVGMGVMYPNLKEDNPSKIVSGFGGTFCLVVSFVYIGLAVMMLGISSPFGSPWQMLGRADVGQQMIYMGMFIFVSLTVGLGPLWYALHRARNFEH